MEMTEQEFMEYFDDYRIMLKLYWKDKSKRTKALKSVRDLIDNYLED